MDGDLWKPPVQPPPPPNSFAEAKQRDELLRQRVRELEIENGVLWEYISDHPSGEDIAAMLDEEIEQLKREHGR